MWLQHGCSGHKVLAEHEQKYGLGMDALVTACSRNTNGIMAWDGLGIDALVIACSWNTNGIMLWA